MVAVGFDRAMATGPLPLSSPLMHATQPEDGGSRHPGEPLGEVVDLWWVRIQLHLRVRRPADAVPDLRAERFELGLVGEAGASGSMPATHVDDDGTDATVRFNVMQGPGQQPLAPGTWRLGPRVRLAGGLDPAAAGARFVIGRHVYEVRPTFDAAASRLALVVTLRSGEEVEAGAEDDDAPATTTGARPAGNVLARLARRVARRLERWAFQGALRAARLLGGRDPRLILFTSDSRGELAGNQKLVHDRMVERGLDREYDLRTLFKPGAAARRPMGDLVRLPWLLGRAGTIVVDDYQPVIYRVDLPDVRIVQLWHAVGAFKTVGYSRVGRPGAPNPFGRTHKNYSLVTVSAPADIPIYAEAFGIPEERVVATGVPRTDRFFDPAYAERARAEALEAFPEARGRRVILFAPTFRGNGARSATYDMDRIDVAALHALCVDLDAVCIVRMHPFVRESLVVPDVMRDRILDGNRDPIDVNDLLFAVDLLVTDYSSIIFEFSTLDRPMLFYVWDLDDYAAARDTYEPFESFVPGRIVRTFPELLEAIRSGDCEAHKVAPFAARHFQHTDGRSTDRVVDLIIGRRS